MKKYVTWSDVQSYIKDLVNNLNKSETFSMIECPGIFTFPRGGLILATLLSYEIDKPILTNPQKGCIIIDDIVDTGITMLKYSKEAKDKDYFITSMFIKDKQLDEEAEYQCFIDHFSYIKNDEWIVYPWEEIDKW